MTTARKVELVEATRAMFGLQPALQALGLPRSTWHYHRCYRRSLGERYGHLRRRLEMIARAHPEYGYRRVSTELRERYGLEVNHKVVQRLHRLWDLSLLRTTRAPRPSGIRQIVIAAGERANLLAQLEAIGPFEVVHTDFTGLVYAAGVAQLIAFVDHETKVVLGWALGPQAVTELALRAWSSAKRRVRRLGYEVEGIIVHQDQDPVFTSYDWTGQLLRRDHARISYTLEGAKGNTEMESFFSRFKNENRSLFEDARDIEELGGIVARRMRYYNHPRRHSALGNRSPLTYVKGLNPRS
jgi:putative transposase